MHSLRVITCVQALKQSLNGGRELAIAKWLMKSSIAFCLDIIVK